MMTLRIGDEAPNFKATTTQGEIDFHEWGGDSWVVFFSHPADFTPVCTTEIGRAASLSEEFSSRNTKRIVLSVDPLDEHEKWIGDVEDTQETDVDYPLIADPEREIAETYDMIHPEADEKATVRSVFFIDPNKKIRATITYPPAIGRSFDEILRVIDALQVSDQYDIATPVDWKKGDPVVVKPSISTEDAREKFEEVTELRDYLRLTPDPSAE
jgi:alkyl hydroperoxide reductase subunit AhpC